MRNRLAIDIASKIKNVTGLILVDGCRFFDYEKYFEVLNNFKKLIEAELLSINIEEYVIIYVFL